MLSSVKKEPLIAHRVRIAEAEGKIAFNSCLRWCDGVYLCTGAKRVYCASLYRCVKRVLYISVYRCVVVYIGVKVCEVSVVFCPAKRSLGVSVNERRFVNVR